MSNIIIPKNFIDGNPIERELDKSLTGALLNADKNGVVGAQTEIIYWKPATEYKGMTCAIGKIAGKWHGVATDGFVEFRTDPNGLPTEHECGQQLHKYINLYRNKKNAN